MKQDFKEVVVTKITRADNQRADELAKMASSLTTWILDRSVAQNFMINQIDLQNNLEELADWRAPLIIYLQQWVLPADKEGAPQTYLDFPPAIGLRGLSWISA